MSDQSRPLSRRQGATNLRLGEELKTQAQWRAARERVPGGLAGAVKLLVSMWVSGKVELELDEV